MEASSKGSSFHLRPKKQKAGLLSSTPHLNPGQEARAEYLSSELEAV